MSSPSSPTLILDVRTRRAEAAVVAWTVAATLAAPGLLSVLTLASAGALGTLTALGAAWGFSRGGWLSGERRIAAVTWTGDGRWLLTDAAGRVQQAALDPGTRVFPRLIWLRWRINGAARRSMLLTSLDLAAPDLRRLAVRLRIEGFTGAPPPGVAAA